MEKSRILNHSVIQLIWFLMNQSTCASELVLQNSAEKRLYLPDLGIWGVWPLEMAWHLHDVKIVLKGRFTPCHSIQLQSVDIDFSILTNKNSPSCIKFSEIFSGNMPLVHIVGRATLWPSICTRYSELWHYWNLQNTRIALQTNDRVITRKFYCEIQANSVLQGLQPTLYIRW